MENTKMVMTYIDPMISIINNTIIDAKKDFRLYSEISIAANTVTYTLMVIKFKEDYKKEIVFSLKREIHDFSQVIHFIEHDVPCQLTRYFLFSKPTNDQMISSESGEIIHTIKDFLIEKT
jgi:hypothetical protein